MCHRLCKRHHNDLFYNVNRACLRCVRTVDDTVTYTVPLNDMVFRVTVLDPVAGTHSIYKFNTLTPTVETGFSFMHGKPSASLRLCVSHRPDGRIERRLHMAKTDRTLCIASPGLSTRIRSEIRSRTHAGCRAVCRRDNGETDVIRFPLGGRVTFNGVEVVPLAESTSVRIVDCFNVPDESAEEEVFLRFGVDVRASICIVPIAQMLARKRAAITVAATTTTTEVPEEEMEELEGTEETGEKRCNVPKQNMGGRRGDFVVVSYGISSHMVKRHYASVELLDETATTEET